MREYYKWQNILLMTVGAVVGMVLAWTGYERWILPQPMYIRVFLIFATVLAGIMVARALSAYLMKQRLRRMLRILCTDLQPEAFVEQFAPVVRQIPDTTVEYVDGITKLAYAYEAMGKFQEGLELLSCVNPAKVRLRMLEGTAIWINQQLRLYLLQQDLVQAEATLQELRSVAQEAARHAPTLASSLKNCIYLAENWRNALTGDAVDVSYLQEEIRIAENRIHKSEMQLLLAMVLEKDRPQEAISLLKAARETGKGIYPGEKAEELLIAQWSVTEALEKKEKS